MLAVCESSLNSSVQLGADVKQTRTFQQKAIQTKMDKNTVSISCMELGNTDTSVLKVATKLLSENNSHFDARLLPTGDKSGHIILIDTDSPTGQEFYQNFNESRQHTLLLLSSETLNEHRHAVLKKPVRVQTLKDTLHDICIDIISKNAPIPKAVEQPVENVTEPVEHTNLESTFFFILWKALRDKQVLQIFCSPYSPLFVDGARGLIATSASRATLNKIIHAKPGSMKSTKLSNADFEILSKGQLVVPLKTVLWSAALHNSQGQLIDKHAPDTLIQLKAWPNLSRLEFNANHMKLASLMTVRPITLDDVEKKTKLSRKEVVAFYNAAYVTDLILVGPAHIPSISQKRISQPAKNSSLLNKIAQRLKLSSTQS